MDLGLAAGAFLLLAIVAFRRVRNVRAPEARPAATTVLPVTRAAAGVLALIGVVWLAVELFR
jgi:hypothetical protein